MNESKCVAILLLASLVLLACACSSTSAQPGPTPWSTPTMSDLVRGFVSPDARERALAAHWAGFYYDHPERTGLVSYVVAALSDPDSDVRMFAANSFRMLGIYDQGGVKTLVSWLDEEGHSGEELVQGIQTLEVFADHASLATPGLTKTMMNPPHYDPCSAYVRQAAIKALAAIADPVSIPYLLSIFLSDTVQDWLRKDAAIALATFGPQTSCGIPYLIPLLTSPQPDVRIGAALIISQATESAFPGSERRNWDPALLGAWVFETDKNGEYQIVNAAKEWWQKGGQYEDWPPCDNGLDGQPVLLPIGPGSTIGP